MATATATPGSSLTHADLLALLAAAMCAAQEQAAADGEPGGAEKEIKAMAEMAGDPEALMRMFGQSEVAESVAPPVTRKVKTIQRDPLTGLITGIVDTVELVEASSVEAGK